jgi:hypothetical protein
MVDGSLTLAAQDPCEKTNYYPQRKVHLLLTSLVVTWGLKGANALPIF